MFIQTHKKNKKAVSVMIGYILLITFAVVIAGFVYSWLKSYVPKQGIDCPSDVSIYISDYNINNGILSLTIRNNGKFSIGGAYIYYSDDSKKEIATNDLSNSITSGGLKLNPGVKFSGETDNSFEPNSEDISLSFDVSQIPYIYSIQITPIRYQEQKNRKQTVSCTNAKTEKVLDADTTKNTQELPQNTDSSSQTKTNSQPSQGSSTNQDTGQGANNPELNTVG